MSVERLTTKNKVIGYQMKCSRCCEKTIPCNECEEFEALVDRIGIIEDILGDSYDLDRLRELVEADRDGRCVVLPCKVGDIVYTNMSIQGDKYKMADRPYPVKVVFVGMGDGKSYFHVKYDNGRCFPFDFDQIGKNVFLTREDAAAALKGGQDA